MPTPLTRPEAGLLLAVVAATAAACLVPAVAQHPNYHAFADQRTWLGLPLAWDVLSNLPFAIAGAWGLSRWTRQPAQASASAHRPLAGLFFLGLLLTAVCSGYYHLHPDNAGLTVDRLGMVAAFAGLLGLACADRISARAGWSTAAAVLVAGPLSVLVWAQSGDMVPWSVLQGGGMLLTLTLAMRPPAPGAWGVRWGLVVAVYALAKVLELGDHAVFTWTQGLVSGHSLKHIVAACAAWPVIALMHNAA